MFLLRFILNYFKFTALIYVNPNIVWYTLIYHVYSMILLIKNIINLYNRNNICVVCAAKQYKHFIFLYLFVSFFLNPLTIRLIRGKNSVFCYILWYHQFYLQLLQKSGE